MDESVGGCALRESAAEIERSVSEDGPQILDDPSRAPPAMARWAHQFQQAPAAISRQVARKTVGMPKCPPTNPPNSGPTTCPVYCAEIE